MWIDVKDRIPKKNGLYNIKTQNGDEKKAYFYLDKILWLSWYGVKISYWWEKNTNKAIFNETHWFENP